MSTSKGKLQDVVILRSFAIIFVVAFHAYGMMYASSHFPETQTIYHKLYYNINQLIFKFRMPLFIFISGYLYSHLILDRGKYPTFTELIKNKFKRLIIPYWIFTFLIMISTNSFNITKFTSGSYSHLWFITMLFWCFIITYIINRITFKKYINIFILLGSFLLLQIDISSFPYKDYTLGLQFISYWYFWFFLGWNIYPRKAQLIKTIAQYHLCIPLILIYILGVTYTVLFIKTDNIRTFGSEIANLSIVISIWFITNKYLIIHLNENKRFYKALSELNKYSYGIYVFHNWIQPYLISRTMKNLFPLQAWAANYKILFPLIFFIVSFIISYILAKYSLKTRIGRFLIG
ncbi:acyltransferase family protein [Bacteroides sp.]